MPLRYTSLLVVAIFLISSCSNQTKNPSVQTKVTPATEEKKATTKIPTFLDRESLQKGTLKDSPFQIGMSMEKVISDWGKPSETDYLNGAKYYLYRKDNVEHLFFVGEDSDSIKHILLRFKPSISLQEVRDKLGQPDVDGLQEVGEAWGLIYLFDQYEIYIDGDSTKPNGLMKSFLLKKS